MKQSNASSSKTAVEQQNNEAITNLAYLNEQLTNRYQSGLDFLFPQEKITKCVISATTPDKQQRFINFSDRVKREWIPSHQLLKSTGEIKCAQISTGERDYYTIFFGTYIGNSLLLLHNIYLLYNLVYILVISLFINVTYGIYERRNYKKSKNNNVAPLNQAQDNAVPDTRDNQENIAPDPRNSQEDIIPNPRNNQEDTVPNPRENQGDIVPDPRENQGDVVPDPRDNQANIVPGLREEGSQDDSGDNLSLLGHSRYLLNRMRHNNPEDTVPNPRYNEEDIVPNPNIQENIVPEPRDNQANIVPDPTEGSQHGSGDNLSLLGRSRYLLNRMGYVPGDTVPEPADNQEGTVENPRNPVNRRRRGRRNFSLGQPPTD